MSSVGLASIYDIVFAAGIVVAAFALYGAVQRSLSRQTLVAVTAAEAVVALVAWVLFAVRSPHERDLAVAAAGLTACALTAAASVALRSALRKADDFDAHLDAAQTTLRGLVDAEARERAAELDRALARARADSVSMLVEEERRLAEDHRREFAQREREIAANLTEGLTATQVRVDERLAGWAQDLDRVAGATKSRIAELAQRQKQLLSEAELRIAADADRIAAESEELRAALQRMRSELEKALEESLSTARSEVDAHAAERRRALHELDERLRRRERELAERIEREQAEAAQRIATGFEDVQRRQVEQLQRVVERAASTYSDEAALQMTALVKSSREDAARRLARELDRAVETFTREAESVLAERLAHVGDAGAQRLERRLAEATNKLEQQRDERLGELDSRIAELEVEIRRRIEELAADA